MNRRLAQGIAADTPRTAKQASVAVIALGSNLGNREHTIASALLDLDRLPMSRVAGAAELIESVAVRLSGPDAAAPPYLNTVAQLTTRLAPTVLLGYLQAIENRRGRERTERWGDRTIDLDLIAYDNVRSDTATLTLPHPRAHERTFVLEPWLALDRDAVLPGAGRVDDLLARLRAKGEA